MEGKQGEKWLDFLMTISLCFYMNLYIYNERKNKKTRRGSWVNNHKLFLGTEGDGTMISQKHWWTNLDSKGVFGSDRKRSSPELETPKSQLCRRHNICMLVLIRSLWPQTEPLLCCNGGSFHSVTRTCFSVGSEALSAVACSLTESLWIHRVHPTSERRRRCADSGRGACHWYLHSDNQQLPGSEVLCQ